MTGLFGIGAALLAGLAAVVANQDGDADIVPFFVMLTVAGGVHAWATANVPPQGWRRVVAWIVAGGWTLAGVWIGALLLLFQAFQGSRPPAPPELTYLGLTATIYHLAGLYGGLTLIVVGTWRAYLRTRDPRIAPQRT
ncbi:MAG: hypothetical protein ACRDGD_09625 [Candidatus Limnocylindria bacterium]